MATGNGHAAVITGGTRGIGLAAAEALAADGYNVAVAGRSDETAMRAAVRRLEQHGVECTGTLLDVRDVAAVASWTAEVERQMAPVSVAVAAAGNLKPQSFLELPVADWDETIDVHLKGTFGLLQAVTRIMVAADRPGSLITLSSFGGIKAAGAGLLDYSAAKGGVVAMTRSLAKELLPYRIRVNSVLPAAETRMTETLRMHWRIGRDVMDRQVIGGAYAAPTDVASIFSYLAGPAGRFVTGQIIAVDGGFGL